METNQAKHAVAMMVDCLVSQIEDLRDVLEKQAYSLSFHTLKNDLPSTDLQEIAKGYNDGLTDLQCLKNFQTTITNL